MLQEVYLTVWNKAAQYDAARGLSPITWLISIARNRSLDRIRSNKRRFGGLDEAAEIPDLAPLAIPRLAARQTIERLSACLDQLDERAATAIRSAFYGSQNL